MAVKARCEHEGSHSVSITYPGAPSSKAIFLWGLEYLSMGPGLGHLEPQYCIFQLPTTSCIKDLLKVVLMLVSGCEELTNTAWAFASLGFKTEARHVRQPQDSDEAFPGPPRPKSTKQWHLNPLFWDNRHCFEHLGGPGSRQVRCQS